MELRGKHAVSFQAVRALAIECHALDLSAYELLFFPVHNDSRGRTRATYDELLTSKMLALAIALRTKFYQGTPYEGTEMYMEGVGFLERERRGSTSEQKVTLKDACDKIIHADSVVRQFDGPEHKPVTVLAGTAPGEVKWTLGFSLAAFADSVLWWLEDVEETYQLCSFLRMSYLAAFSLPTLVRPDLAQRAVEVALQRFSAIDRGPRLSVREQQFVMYRAFLGPLGTLSITQHVINAVSRPYLQFLKVSQLSKAGRSCKGQLELLNVQVA
jgi:hypothetical protein